MKIKKIENPTIENNDTVRVTETGNIVELRYMSYKPNPYIPDKSSKSKAIKPSNAAILHTLKYGRRKTRADNISSMAKSLKRLRELINTNTTILVIGVRIILTW